MSLIGSLEDLNLGDILQIIYLSQKSGVLVIRSGEGEGRILFEDGLVCWASTKGGSTDLRGLLAASGALEPEVFDSVASDCAGADVEAELLSRELIAAEQLDSIRRESVERAVHEMFRWESGEFSFDLQRESDREGSGLRLSKGINPQFLAMERVRLDDESGRGAEFEDGGDDEDDPNEMSAQEMFGVVPDAADLEPGASPEPSDMEASNPLEEFAVASADPIDAIAQLTAARVADAESANSDLVDAEAFAADAGELDDEFGSSQELLEADLLDEAPALLDETAGQPETVIESAPEATPLEVQDAPASPAEESAAAASRIISAPVIVIDVDLVALEWTKKALEGAVNKVHIFQRCDLGLNRIRQYLSRAITPIVVVSPGTPGDPTGGIHNVSDLVKRLKAQAPSIKVLWLSEDDGSASATPVAVEGCLIRPATRDFRNPAAAKVLEAMSRGLRAELMRLTEDASTEVAATASAAPVAPLRAHEPNEIREALAGASSRGEILPLVLHFARQTFARVGLFMVRDGLVMGIAQSGLESCSGPDDHGIRRLSLVAEESAWLRSVLSSKQPRLAGPSDSGDYKLAALLGARAAAEAYVAPIESDGQIVALLYADNLPGGEAISDTAIVDEALREAGLALERALLERTLDDPQHS